MSSAATERIDRREKLLAYTQIPSLHEYAIVSRWRPEVLVYRRARGWTAEVLTEGELRLEAVDLAMPLASIYEGVEFEDTPTPR